MTDTLTQTEPPQTLKPLLYMYLQMASAELRIPELLFLKETTARKLQCGCRCWSCSFCELKSTLLFHKNTQEIEHLKLTFCWKQRGLASLLFGSVLCLKCRSEEVGVEPRLWFAEEHSDTGRWNSRVRSPCLSFLYHWHKHSHICQKPKVRGKERKKRWYLLRQNRFEL